MRVARSPITPSTASTSWKAREISGCQNGRAIYVNSSVTPPVKVNILDNDVLDYQKSGIEVRGPVNATITDNLVDGWGQDLFATNKIASNGILIASGASALVEKNTIKDNWYTPTSTTSCGLFFFQAGGVKQKANTLSGNEANLGNFGRGGGSTNA